MQSGASQASAPSSLEGYVASTTLLSKILAGTLVAGFVLQLVSPTSKQFLALIPGRTLPFVYTTVTSGLLEDALVSVIAYTVGLLFLLRIIEPAYGPREVLRYLLCVLFATGLTTFLLVFLLYLIIIGKEGKEAKAGAILYTEINGFQGAFAALLVAIKQLLPENEVALFGGLAKFRAKHLGALYVLLMIGLGLVAGQALKLVPFSLFGALYGWLYLRYWQWKSEGVRGDLSDEFRFATFFPEPAQPIVDQILTPLASVLRLPGASGGSSAPSQPAGQGHVLGGAAAGAPDDSWEAARRRERGAKALEERLGLANKGEGAPAAGDEEAQAS